MKKWSVTAVIILVVGTLIVIYSIIPSPIKIVSKTGIKTSLDGAYRAIIKQENWDKVANGIHIIEILKNSLQVKAGQKKDSPKINLLLVPMADDSIDIFWETTLPVVKNPISKFQQYFYALSVRKKMTHVLLDYKKFLENAENIYGMPLVEKTMEDTLLAATRFNTKTYPSTKEIYNQIKLLKDYLITINTKQTGYPMLNVTQADSSDFKCTIAIPINKVINDKGDVFFIDMIPRRKFLTAKVTGGINKVQYAHEMMVLYFSDFGRTSMAIPFEYLITDRLQEPDSTKWVTEIFEAIK